MASNQTARGTDRDLAPPMLLGIFPHEEASSKPCVAPECVDRAIGFATFLWRGIVVMPVCHDHAVSIAQAKRIAMPPDPAIHVLTDVAEPRCFVVRQNVRPDGTTMARLREKCG